jgi:hypothetical protein
MSLRALCGISILNFSKEFTMQWNWKIYRDCDTLRLRKIVVELYESGELIHRSRMFYNWLFPCLFPIRLARRQRWMLKVAEKFLAAEKIN